MNYKDFIKLQIKEGIGTQEYFDETPYEGINLTRGDIEYSDYLSTDVEHGLEMGSFDGSRIPMSEGFVSSADLESSLRKSNISKGEYKYGDQFKVFTSMVSNLKDFKDKGWGSFDVAGETKSGNNYKFNFYKNRAGETFLNDAPIDQKVFNSTLKNNLNQVADLRNRWANVDDIEEWDVRRVLNRNKPNITVGTPVQSGDVESGFFNKLFGKKY